MSVANLAMLQYSLLNFDLRFVGKFFVCKSKKNQKEHRKWTFWSIRHTVCNGYYSSNLNHSLLQKAEYGLWSVVEHPAVPP